MAILTSPTDGRTEEQAYDRRWWTLAVLCLSLLIVFGGNSTLNVALPTLARDLDASGFTIGGADAAKSARPGAVNQPYQNGECEEWGRPDIERRQRQRGDVDETRRSALDPGDRVLRQ
mgnify:CR=1 FL=1